MMVLYPWYSFGTPLRQPSRGQNDCGVEVVKQGRPHKRRYALAALVLMCAGPCGLSHHGRRQPECESNLKQLFVATRIVPRPYPSNTSGIPSLSNFPYFAPERGNRYAYFLGPGPLEDRSGPDAVKVPGQMGVGVDTFNRPAERALTLADLPPQIANQVGGEVTDSGYHFLAACAGNTDKDPGDIPDIWTLSTRDRVINGTRVSAAEVFHHVNDSTTY